MIQANKDDSELLLKMLSQKSTPSRHGGWSAAIFIIFVEVSERFAYYGLAGNLIMYLTNEIHQPTAEAAQNVNMWVGFSALFPILGAIVADSYLGRFRTIIYSTSIYFLGMVMLCLSASVVPRHYREGAYFVALYVLAVGEGGHKPCVQTFAADQFDDEDKETKSSFFNWWYLAIVGTATVATTAIIYIQDNVSWVLSYGVLAVVIAAGLVLFLVGTPRYRKDDNLIGSPFTTVAQVFVAAARKWRVKTGRPNEVVYYGDNEGAGGGVLSKHKTLARTKQFRFLDKAMIIDDHDTSSKMRNPWRLCSITQVEEVKLVIRLIPIWLSCLMFYSVQSQLHTYFIKQGSTMIRSVGPNFKFPPASLQALVGLVIVITVPIYDRFLVPAVRKVTGHPTGITVLQRIGVGLFLSIVNMVVAALVETKRIGVAREHNLMENPKATIPISVWWLLPQYFITGLSDAFTVIGHQELFYDQMPDAMRSLGAAAYLSILGVGSFLSSFIISLVETATKNSDEPWLGNNLNRAHLDDFYWLLAGLSALFFLVYLWVAKQFVYKKVVGEASRGDV